MWNNASYWILSVILVLIVLWRAMGFFLGNTKNKSYVFYFIIAIIALVSTIFIFSGDSQRVKELERDPFLSYQFNSAFISDNYTFFIFYDFTVPLFGKVKEVNQETYKAIDNMGEIIQGDKLDNWNIHMELINLGSDKRITINAYDSKGANMHKTYYTFNNSGVIKLVNYNNQDDSTLYRTIHKYNNNNQMLEYDYYSKGEKEVTLFSTDNTGKIIFSTIIYNDSITQKRYYSYDKEGRIKKVEFAMASNDINYCISEFEYGLENVKISNRNFKDGDENKTYFTEEFLYTTFGLLVEYKTWDQYKGEIIKRWNWEYDEHGNLVKGICYENGKPLTIIYRKIKYMK